jgi:ribonuclease HI
VRAHPVLAFVSAAKPSVVYIDGASRGNPGKAAVGVVFVDDEGKAADSFCRTIGTATNNVAEYMALLFAMQAALMTGRLDLEIRTDSELVARQYSGEYKIKEPTLRLLADLVAHLRAGFRRVEVRHVPREMNKLADRQANIALDNEAKLF